MEGAETSSMWPDKERTCKSPRDSDRSGVTKRALSLFAACHVTHGGTRPVIQSSALSAAGVQR